MKKTGSPIFSPDTPNILFVFFSNESRHLFLKIKNKRGKFFKQKFRLDFKKSKVTDADEYSKQQKIK
jgi:hypothetical protein